MHKESRPISGSCTCGAVKYTTVAEPDFSLICQCRQCQKITGTGHAAQFAVPADGTKIHGELRFYKLLSDDGNTVSSGFCSECGNPILKKTSMMPNLLFFHAGSMDKPDLYTPDMVVYEASKQPWDHVDPSLPRK